MAVPDEDAGPRPLRDRRRRRGVYGAGASTQGHGPSQRRRFARNDAELEDLGQETFLRVYRELRLLSRRRPVRALAVTDHGARMLRRAAETTPGGEGCFAGGPGRAGRRPFHGKQPFRPTGPHDPRPGDVAPQTRGPAVITLFELEDRSVREVAELTGWSENAGEGARFPGAAVIETVIGGDDER